MSFEVSPVLVLRVTPTQEDCTVELLSCKVENDKDLRSRLSNISGVFVILTYVLNRCRAVGGFGVVGEPK